MLVLASLSILFTLLRLLRRDHWSVRFFDFPVLQITVFSILIFTGLLIFREGWTLLNTSVLVILAVTVLLNAYVIIPYTRLGRKESVDTVNTPDSKCAVSLLVSNVYMENRSYGQLIGLIERNNPDIILTLETDHKWESALNEITGSYLYSHGIALQNMYGMHLFSRFPIHAVEERYLIQQNVPSIRCQVELDNGQRFWLYCVHPKPPSPTENDYSTARDGELYKIAMEVNELKQPVIVAGDLNDVAWSHSTRMFLRLSHLQDPRKGRGLFNTFPAKWPWFRWPLDHIFHSAHFSLTEMNKLGHIGSDHFPISITLQLEHAMALHESQEASKSDKSEAKEKIVEAEE